MSEKCEKYTSMTPMFSTLDYFLFVATLALPQTFAQTQIGLCFPHHMTSLDMILVQCCFLSWGLFDVHTSQLPFPCLTSHLLFSSLAYVPPVSLFVPCTSGSYSITLDSVYPYLYPHRVTSIQEQSEYCRPGSCKTRDEMVTIFWCHTHVTKCLCRRLSVNFWSELTCFRRPCLKQHGGEWVHITVGYQVKN